MFLIFALEIRRKVNRNVKVCVLCRRDKEERNNVKYKITDSKSSMKKVKESTEKLYLVLSLDMDYFWDVSFR